MNKYDNHVYLTICEISFKLFKETHYATYSSYCKNMCDLLKDGIIPDNRKKHLWVISKSLGLIFAINHTISGEYISRFFIEEKYLIFERPVRMAKEFFPNLQELC